ncbi:DUF481 domain-containing protein [Portibacter marinus]|uniref:DUF481 domain-containing protein n=1 Tax=Portibacter marinus TaxID=2898660 RepID=UPI001F474EEE|nr:DUF481 domain-containing protein [Portibacter marinus]
MVSKLYALAFLLFLTHNLFGQSESLKVFIDCDCDRSYLRQELSYLNHVRDQDLSDVQIFVNAIRNGGGGANYDITFRGRNEYEGAPRELSFSTTNTMSNDEIRELLKKKIEQGILYYLLDTDLANRIEFIIPSDTVTIINKTVEEDPWNNWIFEIGAQGNGDKESNRSSFRYEVDFEVDRVTEEWRLRGDAGFDRAEIKYQNDGDEFLSVRESYYLRGSVVKSINNHWSSGIFTGLNHNTYSNIGLATYIQPALEYNIFPYEEVIRREITFAYKIGYLNNQYIERTIFDKVTEDVFRHSLSVNIRFRQPWGDIFASLLARTFITDITKNRVALDSYLNIRIFKGLSLRLSADFSLIRDQINLPSGNASLEDILLQQKQIATDFQIRGFVGLSYTFGSAFNNILNTRL